jgi:hypothetical protein
LAAAGAAEDVVADDLVGVGVEVRPTVISESSEADKVVVDTEVDSVAPQHQHTAEALVAHPLQLLTVELLHMAVDMVAAAMEIHQEVAVDNPGGKWNHYGA